MKAITTESSLLVLQRQEPSHRVDKGEVEAVGQVVYPGPAS